MKISVVFVTFLLFEYQIRSVNSAGLVSRIFQRLFGNQQGNSASTTNTSTAPFGQGPFGSGEVHVGGPPMLPFDIDFMNDTCPINTDASTPCLVGPPFNESSGAWVCRTLYDIVTGEADTFSACVDTHHFVETDECGCCGGSCPSVDPCTCTCDLPAMPPMMGDNGGRPPRGDGNNLRPPRDGGSFNITSFNITGVLVEAVGSDNTVCVPQNMSSKMINGPGFFGRFECVTSCP
jgi:hypothetical protein